MAATFAFQANGSQATTSGAGYVTSLTPALPSGWAAGDVLFLWAKGSHNATYQTWSPGSGWVQFGASVQADDGFVGGQRYNSLQLWVKIATSGATAPTVTLTSAAGSGITRGWQTATFNYRAISGTPPYGIVTACVDEVGTSGSSFTATSLVAPREATAVNLAFHTGTGGTITVSNAQGFTVRTTPTNTPAGRIMDKNTTPTTVTMPSFSSSGTRPWLSKSFAFDRLAGYGKYVGRVVR